MICRLASPNPRTYIGSGKVAEIKSAIRALGIETVIFDDELSAGWVCSYSLFFFMILLMHVIISHKRGTVHHWHYYYFVKISSPKSFLNSLIFRSFLLVLWLELIFCKLTVDWHCFCSTCIFLFKRTKLFSHYIELIVSLPLGNWETWKNHLVEM